MVEEDIPALDGLGAEGKGGGGHMSQREALRVA